MLSPSSSPERHSVRLDAICTNTDNPFLLYCQGKDGPGGGLQLTTTAQVHLTFTVDGESVSVTMAPFWYQYRGFSVHLEAGAVLGEVRPLASDCPVLLVDEALSLPPLVSDD